MLRTPDSEVSQNHWIGFEAKQKSITIDIRACSNARLVLAQTPSSIPVYAVVLGHSSNTKSKIVRYGPTGFNEETVAESDTQNIVDCYEWRRFCLTWANNKLELRRMSSSGDVLLDWYDDNLKPVFALALTTGPDSIGDWKYSYRSGQF